MIKYHIMYVKVYQRGHLEIIPKVTSELPTIIQYTHIALDSNPGTSHLANQYVNYFFN